MTLTTENGKPTIVDKYELLTVTRVFKNEQQLKQFIGNAIATGMEIKIVNKNEKEQEK
jgi:hypothetical protein